MAHDPSQPPPPSDAWHPKVQAIYDYWRRCGPEHGLAPGLLPGRQHIDPLVLKPLLPNIWLLDVVREGDAEPHFRHRLMGTKVVEMRNGHNPTGQLLDETTPARIQPNPTLARLRRMVETAEPSWRHGAPNNMQIPDIRMVENMFLPLAADGRQVDMVLCFSLFFGLNGAEL